jgi:hypothetical protein
MRPGKGGAFFRIFIKHPEFEYAIIFYDIVSKPLAEIYPQVEITGRSMRMVEERED